MYSVKNDECPYDESYNVGCVIILGDLKYLTRDTFRVDSLVSGIFHIFQALTGCFLMEWCLKKYLVSTISGSKIMIFYEIIRNENFRRSQDEQIL